MNIRKILEEMSAARPADQVQGDLAPVALPVDPEAEYDGTNSYGNQQRPADQLGNQLPAQPGTPIADPVAAIQPGEGTEVQGNTLGEEILSALREGLEFKVDVESVKGLVEAQELDEEFKAQAIEVFESAINATVNEQVEKILAKATELVEAKIEQYAAVLEEDVNQYVTHVATTWLNENRLAIDSGVKNTISESFMTGLQKLLSEHYVEIPEDKVDALQEAIQETQALEVKLEEEAQRSFALSEEVATLKKALVVEQALVGLTKVQGSKLRQIAEGLEFTEEGEFKSKLSMVIEGLKTAPNKSQTMLEDVQPVLTESTNSKSVDSEVSEMARQMGRFAARK